MMLAACSMRGVQAGLLLLATFAIILVLHNAHSSTSSIGSSGWMKKVSVSMSPKNVTNVENQWPHLESAQQLWNSLKPILEEHAPPMQKPTTPTASSNNNEELKRDSLGPEFNMTLRDVVRMGEIHDNYVQESGKKIPSLVHSSNKKPTHGIVTIAGGSSFPELLMSLKMLRRTGSKLPVEVFVPKKDELEVDICDNALPKMNARCILLSDILSPGDASQIHNYTTARTQYKILSILFSSFTSILFLDAGNFALRDPTPLFTSDPFTTHGLLTWPSTNSRSISPLYHLIANHTAPPPSLPPSPDLGQLLISKRTHRRTLLLAAYYSYHGPTYFHALLAQPTPSGLDTDTETETETDTLTPAAATLGAPYYQVHAPTLPVGHNKAGTLDLHTYAHIQHDPAQDFAKRVLYKNKNVDGALTVRPFFLRAEPGLFDPRTMLARPAEGKEGFDLTRDWDGREVPAFKDPGETVERLQGVERGVWEVARDVACEFEGRGEEERRVCRGLRNYWTMKFRAADRANGVGQTRAGREARGRRGRKMRA